MLCIDLKKIICFIFLFLFSTSFCDDIYFINSDETVYEKENILCSGNVVIIYCGRIISADYVSYDQKKESIHAKGNVIIKDEKQNVYFIDWIKINKNFSSGEGKNIKIIMPDKSRLAAKKCSIKNNKFRLDDVIYTPCYECIYASELTWQMKSSRVDFDPDDITEYSNSTIEFLGNPLLYFPYLSQPSPKIKKRTGFLSPKFVVSSKSGFSVLPQYFIAIDEYQELILKPIITSKIGSVGWIYYGRRFRNGEFYIDASITGTKSVDKYNSGIWNRKEVEKIKKSGYRGHVFSKTKFEIDEIWRCGLDINLASDIFYLKRFPFFQQFERTLESKAFIEGFDGRNYTSVKTAMFQSIVGDSVPKILPVIERNFSHDLLFGTFDIDAMFMNLEFNNSRSMQKALTNVSWSKNIMMPYGNILDFKGLISLKAMKVSEKQHSDYDSSFNTSPQVSAAWKWPLLCKLDFCETIFTPIIGVIAAGNKKYYDAFEDPFSEINDINFLEGSRGMSPYNIDSGSRIAYGAKVSSYKEGRNLGYFTLGRSTELTKIQDRLDATGLKYKNSNIITSADIFLTDEITFKANGSYSDKTKRWIKFESGLRFANQKFDADIFAFNGKQCFYNPFMENVDLLSEEEKVQKYKGAMIDLGWKTTKSVKLKTGIIFGADKNKLIKYNVGMEYKNECTQMELSIERTNYQYGDIRPETSFKFMIHLKNLGV